MEGSQLRSALAQLAGCRHGGSWDTQSTEVAVQAVWRAVQSSVQLSPTISQGTWLQAMRGVNEAIMSPNANLTPDAATAMAEHGTLEGSPELMCSAQQCQCYLTASGRCWLRTVGMALEVLAAAAPFALQGAQYPSPHSIQSNPAAAEEPEEHKRHAQEWVATHRSPLIIEVLDDDYVEELDASAACTAQPDAQPEGLNPSAAQREQVTDALIDSLMLIVATYLDPVPEPAHTPPSGTPCLGQPLATPHLLLQPLALTQAMLAQGSVREGAEGPAWRLLEGKIAEWWPSPWALPQPSVSQPQASGRVAATSSPALSLLYALADVLRQQGGSEGGARGGGQEQVQASLADAVVAQQSLLQAAAVRLLPRLRRVMASGADANMTPSEAPSVRERATAARQAAVLIRALTSPSLSASGGGGWGGKGGRQWAHSSVGGNERDGAAVVGVALSAALTLAQDPSPAVAVHGLAALHHLATHGLAPELRWQQALLLDAAKRMLVGCSEALWQPALLTATTLAAVLLGDDCRAPGYHMLMAELLTEVERNAHKPERRLPFLAPSVLHLMLGGMRLTATRHFTRLLPLLLEWLQCPDEASRTAACDGLQALAACTWPRMPAHAPLMWLHLARVVVREAAAAPGTTKGAWDSIAQHVAPAGDSHSPPDSVLLHTSPSAAATAAAAVLGRCGGEGLARTLSMTVAALTQLQGLAPDNDAQTGSEASGTCAHPGHPADSPSQQGAGHATALEPLPNHTAGLEGQVQEVSAAVQSVVQLAQGSEQAVVALRALLKHTGSAKDSD